jgi:cystathionine beta-lyase
MNYDFDTLPQRRGAHSVKWDITDEDVLPLWVADMDFKSSPAILTALQAKVEHGVFGYPYFGEEPHQSVVDWVNNRHQWSIKTEDVLFIPGVITGFNLAAHTVAQPGDGYLVQTPTYGPFFAVAKNTDLVQHETEMTTRQDGNYNVDLQAFKDAITPETRIFMLCNPQNPTGRVFRKKELEGMAEICLQNDIVICSDEIHSDLVFSGHKHVPIASLDKDIAQKTITLIAPSKTFNIAGLKASAAIIQNPELREAYANSKKGLASWVNYLGMTALIAAYRDCADWLEALIVYLEANRDFLLDYVQTHLPGISMLKPEGTYLAWLNCSQAGIDNEPHEFFLEKAKVMLNEGKWFGKGGEGYIRLNFGCPRSVLERALERMKKALEEL